MYPQGIIRNRIGGAVTSAEPTSQVARWLVAPTIFIRPFVGPKQSGWQRVSSKKVAGDLPVYTTMRVISGKMASGSGAGVATSSPPGSTVTNATASALARAAAIRGYGSGR